MKVVKVETIIFEERPIHLYVTVETDEGLMGIGETHFGAQAVAAWIHETGAPYLLGKDPRAIDKHWKGLDPFVGFASTSVENRGRAALDIALWDLQGKRLGVPVYELLGGASRDGIRIYNTCAGDNYLERVEGGGGLPTANWGLDADRDQEVEFDDLNGFLNDAGAVAESLLDEGVTGMKIWPFDFYAEASGGTYISTSELKEGLEPFRKIRAAVGDKIEIMAEMHGLWNLPSAVKIARALEEFQPTWIEDPVKMDNLDVLARFREGTTIPVTASETLGTRSQFSRLLALGAADIIMFDPAWTGGLSESKKIATMAESYGLPIAAHDCSGPIEFAAAVHLATNTPNTLVQETVRAYYRSWYAEFADDLPRIENGTVWAPSGPGLGTSLRPDVLERKETLTMSSALNKHDEKVSVG